MAKPQRFGGIKTDYMAGCRALAAVLISSSIRELNHKDPEIAALSRDWLYDEENSEFFRVCGMSQEAVLERIEAGRVNVEMCKAQHLIGS